MIFLSLLALGILTGLAFGTQRRSGLQATDAAYGGATGSFLAGATVVGILERSVGAFDPIVLLAGVSGAIGCVWLIERLKGWGRPNAGRGANLP